MSEADERPTTPAPSEALRRLEVLTGEWEVSGPEIGGRVRYEWMAGGGFLVQHVELIHEGQQTTGIEYIGYDKESDTLRSHYFASSGEILEYTYTLDGDILTIWHPAPGSPAFFRGQFSADRDTNTGRWIWPGGGYESTMTRVG